MQWFSAIQAVWQMWNGKKFNTGATVTILALVFQQVFAKYGATHDVAVSMATYLVMGGGAVLTLVGWIHQLIKASAAKKAAAVGKVTGTADNTIAGGTIVPLLFLCFLIFGAFQAQAKETFNQPFAYLYMKVPPSDMKVTDGLWVIKPAPSFSLLGVTRKGSEGVFIASPFSGSGLGVSIERMIPVNGDFYTSFSLSFNGLFSPIPDTKDYKFSGSMLFGTNIYPIGIIGIGPGFDGKSASFVIGYEGGFKF